MENSGYILQPILEKYGPSSVLKMKIKSKSEIQASTLLKIPWPTFLRGRDPPFCKTLNCTFHYVRRPPTQDPPFCTTVLFSEHYKQKTPRFQLLKDLAIAWGCELYEFSLQRRQSTICSFCSIGNKFSKCWHFQNYLDPPFVELLTHAHNFWWKEKTNREGLVFSTDTLIHWTKSNNLMK